MRIAALTLLAACSAPATRPTTVSNATSPAAHARVEHELQLDGDCDLKDAQRFPLDEAGRETVAIVVCESPVGEADTQDETSERMNTAHFVRRSTSDTHGTDIQLGYWFTAPEQGEYFEVVGLVRAARGNVTHVLVHHGKGGLDQIPEAEIRDYLPAQNAFAGTVYTGTTIGVDVAPGDTHATLTICTLAVGGTYDQQLSCDQQQGATVKTVTIGP